MDVERRGVDRADRAPRRVRPLLDGLARALAPPSLASVAAAAAAAAGRGKNER